jgi:hypothetical protein
LHHADDPAEILRNVVRFVPPGAPVVIGEFHPEGPCTSGPPRNHRLAPEKVQEWCKARRISGGRVSAANAGALSRGRPARSLKFPNRISSRSMSAIGTKRWLLSVVWQALLQRRRPG